LLESWVKFLWTIKWESRHCVSKDWDIARSRRNTQWTGSWTEHLLTWRSWLKTGLPPTAVTSLEKRNGHQTHQTLIFLISMSGELCLNVTKHFNSSKYHRRAEESLANNMEWSASELYQQGHTELSQKTSSLCESWEWTLWTCLQINCFRRILNY